MASLIFLIPMGYAYMAGMFVGSICGHYELANLALNLGYYLGCFSLFVFSTWFLIRICFNYTELDLLMVLFIAGLIGLVAGFISGYGPFMLLPTLRYLDRWFGGLLRSLTE